MSNFSYFLLRGICLRLHRTIGGEVCEIELFREFKEFKQQKQLEALKALSESFKVVTNGLN